MSCVIKIDHHDDSFEYTQHELWLQNKKIKF